MSIVKNAVALLRAIPSSNRCYKVQPAQFAALQKWAKPVGERFAYLSDIKISFKI
jgi:hypothetical protein